MWIISRRACLLYYIRMWWFVFCAGDRLAKMLQFVDNIADSHLMLRFFHDTHHKSRARFELSFYFSRLISSIPTPPHPTPVPECLAGDRKPCRAGGLRREDYSRGSIQQVHPPGDGNDGARGGGYGQVSSPRTPRRALGNGTGTV